jgi:hypothetical protein
VLVNQPNRLDCGSARLSGNRSAAGAGAVLRFFGLNEVLVVLRREKQSTLIKKLSGLFFVKVVLLFLPVVVLQYRASIRTVAHFM